MKRNADCMFEITKRDSSSGQVHGRQFSLRGLGNQEMNLFWSGNQEAFLNLHLYSQRVTILGWRGFNILGRWYVFDNQGAPWCLGYAGRFHTMRNFLHGSFPATSAIIFHKWPQVRVQLWSGAVLMTLGQVSQTSTLAGCSFLMWCYTAGWRCRWKRFKLWA